MFDNLKHMAEEVVQAVENKVEEPKAAETQAPVAPVAPVTEDRSAFNCPACGGEGLKDGTQQDALCPQCNGTGKV